MLTSRFLNVQFDLLFRLFRCRGDPWAREGGIVIAEVRADDETFSCEDSCIYANDGECDEEVYILPRMPIARLHTPLVPTQCMMCFLSSSNMCRYSVLHWGIVLQEGGYLG